MTDIFERYDGKLKRVHGAFAVGPLDIAGQFTSQGPQLINNRGGCPAWVAALFDKFPDLDQIALSGKDGSGSQVYSRLD